tara:strand:+ start:1207 stop:1932 length:726 start_codon:yes stop_codon:yes gene_type:complete
MNVLVVIPARGGSVRVPRKNVKLLNGKPLIAYAINAAKKSSFNPKIVVSTDDYEIKSVALEHGAEVPFKRPPHLSEDVPTEDVILHTVEWLEENESYSADIVVCLEPPVPLRTSEHIDQCIDQIATDEDIDSVVTVTDVGATRPEWMMRVGEDGYINLYSDHFKNTGDGLMKFPASQSFEKLYKISGAAFACRPEILKQYKGMVGPRCKAVKIDPSVSFDLDTPADFEVLQHLLTNNERAF